MQRDEKAVDSLDSRPGIFVIGSSNVGKRTLLSRLLSVDFEDGPDSFPDVSVHGWNINTKYYTADVSVWMTHLHEGFSIRSLPILDQLEALVMVFDISDLSSLTALQDWVSQNDIRHFEILLCIGNKVDRLPGHPVHAEYRRRLLKQEDEIPDYYGELNEGGISETEGISLLGEEEPSSGIRKSCLEWCSMHGIEYIEACASNADFDKCLSVDGDLQGVERLFGALSAHMWPGMVLKSGDKIAEPTLPEQQDSSDDEKESEYEFDYEILSAGSAEQWDVTEDGWVSASDPGPSSRFAGSVDVNFSSAEHDVENRVRNDEKEPRALNPEMISSENTNGYSGPEADVIDENLELEEGGVDLEDLEQLMSEIGNIRDSLRFMPDFQRREMAAKLAVKMASMFGGGSDGEEE